MKSTLLYLLMILCCEQPALAQFESDEQFEQQAAKQLGVKYQPSVKKTATQRNTSSVKQSRRNTFGASYGYRPQRGSTGSGYGYRPQRANLLPQGYSQEMLQQKMQRLQQMQQMMGGGAQQPQQQKPNPLQMMMGGGAQQPQQQKPNPLQMLMGGGAQQPQQQKPNPLQMLMGGGAQQPQQQAAQPQFNRGELLKTFFGDGSTSHQAGE